MGNRPHSFRQICVGMLQVNCYLIPGRDGRLYIIDPGDEADAVAAVAEKLKPKETVILLTHGHVDHIRGVREAMNLTGAKTVVLHPDDLGLYRSPQNCVLPWLPPAENLPQPVEKFASDDFTILHTPGHTAGCVCYHFPEIQAVFTGDTLFQGSVGRTDLPGGNAAKLIESIRDHLLGLPDSLAIYPGHGPSTTIGNERKSNPFLS